MTELRRICQFLKIDRSDDFLRKVIVNTEIQKIKAAKDTSPAMQHAINLISVRQQPNTKPPPAFYRKGKLLYSHSHKDVPPEPQRGGRVVRRCWVNFQCRGVLLIWIIVGQGPTALAVGAGGGCLDIFSLIYHFSFLSPSLWETARYRLKYCLKGPLSPKQPTNPNLSGTDP